MSDTGIVHVAARFPTELADELERVAVEQDRSRSSIVRRAVRAYLEAVERSERAGSARP